MTRFTPATRVWFVALALVATVLSGYVGSGKAIPLTTEWLALSLLGFCAAIAHRYPIKSGAEASYRLTNVFLVAGTLILPLPLLPPLAFLALALDTVLEKRRLGILLRLLVNLPPTILAMVAAGWCVAALGGARTTGFGGVLVGLVAGSVFTLTQNILLGVGMASNFRVSLWRVAPLSRTTLQGEALFALLGVIVAGLWLADPAWLLLVLPFLVLVHRLTGTAHLAKLAQTDEKTGLHNARYFEQVLAQEIDRAGRLGLPLAVLFLDLDYFKQVNDRYGHDAGDSVLQEVGTRLTATLRTGDVAARFGGEEFVVLLPGTDALETSYVAERVRAAIGERPFTPAPGVTLKCTASVGMALYPTDGTSMAELLKRADEAMYRAKRVRNTVAHAGGLPSVPRLVAPVAVERAPAAAAAAPPPKARWYASLIVWGTILAGALALAWSLSILPQVDDWPLLIGLLLLAAGAEFVVVQVAETERQKLSLSFGAVVVMAALTILPASAPLVTAVAAAVHVARLRQWRRGIDRVLFNLTNPGLAAAIAALAYLALLTYVPQSEWSQVLAATVAVGFYYGLNNGIIALNIAAQANRPLLPLLQEMAWAAPATLLLGATGAFLGAEYALLGPFGALMFVVPLLVLRFTLGVASRKSRQALATLAAAKAEVEGAHAEKEHTLRQLIDVVAAIIDARDQAVAGHSDRVARYAIALGEEMGLTPRELAYLHTAGLLHDLGKIAIPEAILHKPAKLTTEEFAVVKEHAATGERILSEVQPLLEVARMVGDHHERFDGGGYPNAEAGMAITRGGRILAVADTLDSILSDRPYSKGKPLAWAIDEAERCAGTHFDPEVVAALQRVLAKRGPQFFTSTTESTIPKFEGNVYNVVRPTPVENQGERQGTTKTLQTPSAVPS
ncbi:MAG TPA: diguanylate cyclase [Thermomicrobiales bacterium]|jgi:diguanylate cyclase (GGDEF)-like protein/putative nucleotidyltransferase with HDIG domain